MGEGEVGEYPFLGRYSPRPPPLPPEEWTDTESKGGRFWLSIPTPFLIYSTVNV